MEIIDFEQRVTRKIRANNAFPGFPKPEDYGVTKEDVDDYLLDKQAVLDSEGSSVSQYTIAGVLIVLPVIVLSAFSEKQLPWGSWSLFVGLAIGLCLAALAKVLMKLRIKARLKRIYDEKIEKYINAVLVFDEENK